MPSRTLTNTATISQDLSVTGVIKLNVVAAGLGLGSLALLNNLTGVALGTPSSGGLTNCTGLPIGGLTGLGTGVGTALGTIVTGSGSIVLASSPVFNSNINFGTSTGISLISAGTLAVGNGTVGDISGTLEAASFLTGTAGSGNSVLLSQSGGLGAIWLASNTASPSLTNYTLLDDGGNIDINAPPGRSNINFRFSNSTVARINSSGINLSAQTNSSPSDGDLWFDGTHLNFRSGGVTHQIV